MKKRHKGLFVVLLLTVVAAVSVGIVAISKYGEAGHSQTAQTESDADAEHNTEDHDHEDEHDDSDAHDEEHDHDHEHNHDHEANEEAAEAAALYTIDGLSEVTPADGTLTVVTSFYPMYISTLNVIGEAENVELENLSEPQTGCLHDYTLTPADMKLLATADVFIINGGGIETFLLDVAEAYPNLTIVNASDGISMTDENSHVWMSVDLYRSQSDNITKALSVINPANSSVYSANGYAYDRKLDELAHRQAKLIDETDGMEIISLHEAYGYLADDYGMEVAYLLNLDEERQVSANEVAEVVTEIKEHDIKAVLAEADYGSEMGTLLEKETGVKVYYLDTLTRGTYYPDAYIDAMSSNIDLIEKLISDTN